MAPSKGASDIIDYSCTSFCFLGVETRTLVGSAHPISVLLGSVANYLCGSKLPLWHFMLTCGWLHIPIPHHTFLPGRTSPGECWYCGDSDNYPGIQCRGCRLARYCGRRCQKKGWSRQGHKEGCMQWQSEMHCWYWDPLSTSFFAYSRGCTDPTPLKKKGGPPHQCPLASYSALSYADVRTF